MDRPESGAVLNSGALALSQHALVDPGEIISLHSEGEREAGQQPQCQLLGLYTEIRQCFPQLRTILKHQLFN